MFDALFTYIFGELIFHKIVEDDLEEYIMGIDPAIGEDFSGRI